MLISPPFLLPSTTGETDDQWVARCMTGDAPGHGAYPLSHQLEWHGGLHLTAPRNGINVAAVRAIADGKVIFMRNATTVKAADEGHPLNYFSGYTSDGCVIIEHTTEIGEGTNANVVFYSVYHHLTNIPEQIAKDKRIYRKEIIGHAGHIYGEQDRFHFEICCDEVNLQKLVGRISGPLPTASNGRTDAVFGAMYFSIPDGTPVYAQQPVPYRLDGQWQAPKSPKNSAWPEIATQTAASTTVGELIMGLRYGGGEGDAPGGAELTTYRPDGSIIGEVILETDAEYNLYQTANGIVKEWARAKKADARQYPDVPAPSAVFELLRFGRIINSANEKLTPANAAHWRKVRYDGGEGWINLNAENVHQFSDADFPHWKGSLLIDDDSIASDSKCDSATIKKMLDVDGNNTVTQQEAQAKLNDVSVKGRLQRTICKFPCEWEEATLETRWGWLKNKTEENSKPYTDDEYKDVINHLKALCFACPELFAAQWRFEPREFVKKFQSCGWMSLHEMVQMLPRRIENSSNDKVELKWAAALDNLRGTNKDTRLTSTVLNKVMRKYGITSDKRQTAFFAQIYIETGLLRTVTEGGKGTYNSKLPMKKYYAAFYGRGLMQLTWASAYEKYGQFRSFPNNSSDRYVDERITATSTHYWAAPTSRANGASNEDPRQWAPAYDPDIIASNCYNACDSACFFWISKSFLGQKNINRIADQGITSETIGKISVLINGGSHGYENRQRYAAFIDRYRSNTVSVIPTENKTYLRQIIHNVNGHTAWRTSGEVSNFFVNYKAQREQE